jgi:hypothetical protein
MKFRARLEVWLDVGTLDQAQAAAHALEAAVFDVLAASIVPAPEGGGLSRTELEPMDEESRAAFAADDLGPGISSVRFEYGRADPDSA